MTAFEVREGTMIAMDAGEHVIVLSGYGPLISVDRLSQSGDELEPYICTVVHTVQTAQ